MNYFITHCDKNYLPIVEKLFQSLESNSKLKILFYTINFEYENKFKNVIPIHYNTEFNNIKGNNISNRNILNNNENIRANMLFLKSKICQKALEYHNGDFCYVDADCIALQNADDIFNEGKNITNYPLLGENCHEYMIYDNRGNPLKNDGSFDINLCLEADLLKLLEIPLQKRISLYRQSNIILFNNKCKSIINEWVDICYSEQVINNWLKYASFNDETVLNCILWKNDYLNHLKQISINIPSIDIDGYSSINTIKSFIESIKNPKYEDYYFGTFCKIPSISNICNLKFLHGKLNDKQYRLIKENFFHKKEKYYVTHCDEKYLANAEKLFESLKLNSNLKILFYTVNFKYENKFENVIPIYYSTEFIQLKNNSEYKNINNDSETEVVNLLFLKPKICNEVLNYGDHDYCYIDADCIALKDCDAVFENSKNITNYPLLPKGPHEYICRNGKGIHFNNDGSINLNLCLEADLLKFIGSHPQKRTNLYRTAHIILFDLNCKNILKEYADFCNNREILINWERYAPLTDETVMNCILWKYDCLNNLNQISIHVPSLENNEYVSDEKFEKFIDAYQQPKNEEYMYENFTRIPSDLNINNIKFFHGKINNNHFNIVKEKIFKISNNMDDQNKYLLIIHSTSLGDTIAVTPVLRKLYNSYNSKISVLTYHPDIFKNNKYVDNLYDFNTTDIDKIKYIEKFETFLGTGGYKNQYGVEKKHNTIDIRQFHALDLGFMLSSEEMSYDYTPNEYLQIENLPNEYVCIHVSNTWPSRTYADEKLQKLINELNIKNIPVVLVGKNSSEKGFYNIDKKTKNLSLNLGLDLTNKLDLSQCWHVINKSTCFITMDSGLLHLAGTTDTFIVQLGSSIDNKLRAPYRNNSQDYKYKYISGPCNLFCASDIKYGVKEWKTIQGVPPLINCLENKNTFECHPHVDDLYQYIINNFKFENNKEIEIFNFDRSNCTIHYRSLYRNIDCKIEIWDKQTKTLIYVSPVVLNLGINYWTNTGFYKNYITNDIIVKFYEKEKLIQENIFKVYEKDNITEVSNLIFDYDIHFSNLYEIFISKDYEYNDIKIEHNDLVVDIGSNLSTFIHYALLKGAKKVYSCEPNPNCIKIIEKYFKENHKVKINKYGISDKDEINTLVLGVNCDVAGSSKLISAKANTSSTYEHENKIEVLTKKFSTFIKENNLNKIDYLKVDCEGGEVFIFTEENKEFIKNNINKIAIEYHNSEKNNIINFLKNLDFEVYEKNNSSNEIIIGMIYAKNRNYKTKPVFLFLAPHLSTGGSPAYLEWLLNKKQKENFECYVIEYCNYGSYDVQKNKIKNIVGENNFFTCGNHWDSDEYYDGISDKIIDLINNINPDIIHLNELSEIFSLKKLTDKILNYLYNNDRKFKLLETSHTSQFDFHNKKFLPDQFDFCSKYHLQKSEFINIPKQLVEMEIPLKIRPNRSATLSKLNLQSDYFHVLNVGLFNEFKNQKYLFDLAEKVQNKKIMFHFLGNTCFFDNCKISDLQKNLPNCKIWGERSDVDVFMSCMDLFVFPSVKELNPISIKEALSWSMPCFINKLDTYCGKYDNNPLITYINNDNLLAYLNNISNA
jgi:FkbM family methyltransferase